MTSPVPCRRWWQSVLFLLLPLALTECAGTPRETVQNAACGPEHAAFATAAGAAAAGGLDALAARYAALRACRLARADAIRAAAISGALQRDAAAQQLASERATFAAETATARQVEERIAAQDAGPQAVAALRRPAPPRGQGFLATAAATIYSRPDSASAPIASLRKGQWVQGPGDNSAPGWTTLTLNEGSIGYVESGALRPTHPNPCSIEAASRGPRLSPRLAAFASALDAADREDSVAFDSSVTATRPGQGAIR